MPQQEKEAAREQQRGAGEVSLGNLINLNQLFYHPNECSQCSFIINL